MAQQLALGTLVRKEYEVRLTNSSGIDRVSVMIQSI